MNLRKCGLFKRLEEMGIQDGDVVDIYDMEFEYQKYPKIQFHRNKKKLSF